MKRSFFRITLVLGLLGGLLTSGGAVGADTDQQGVGDSWIVVLKDGVAPAPAAEALARAHGGDVGHVYEHVLGGFSLTASPQAAAALANNPLVARVEADQAVEAFADVPTGVSRVDAAHGDGYGTPGRTAAHDEGYRGAGTYVAVLDTGVDSSHPDLDVDTSLGEACITSTTEDVHGHGTHVAGTAAALDNGSGVVGVAPGATVIPVKVLGDDGSGSWASVLCGVDHVTALAEGAVPGVNVSGPIVANMSLGGSSTGGSEENALQDGLADSVAAGVTHVVAAGNSGADSDGFVPARFPEVITVSALTDLDGEPGGQGGCITLFPPPTDYCDDTFANFSNFGDAVDVIAPGVFINSTVPGGGYDEFSGTSMASPHAAGVAALALGEDSSLGPEDIRALLQSTGECPDGDWNSGGATCAGQGQWDGDPDGIPEPLVNAFRAADAAAGGGPSDPEPTGTVVGTVTDHDTGTGVGGADVTLDGDGGTFTAETAGDGTYAIDDVPTGSYTATASASGYDSDSGSITVEEDTTSTLDFVLAPLPEPELGVMSIDLEGEAVGANGRWNWAAEATATVTDEDGDPVSGATVAGTWESDDGTSTDTCTTGSAGTCTVASDRIDERVATEATFTVGDVSHPDFELDPNDEGASVTVFGP